MTQFTFEVKVIPSPGGGMPFVETVQAVNVPQARQLVESRIPSDWKTCYPRRVS